MSSAEEVSSDADSTQDEISSDQSERIRVVSRWRSFRTSVACLSLASSEARTAGSAEDEEEDEGSCGMGVERPEAAGVERRALADV